MTPDDILTLQSVLDEGDLELRLHDDRSIKAHSLKLKLASRGGVLHNLIEDVMDDQITGNKRKRSDSDAAADPPSLRVSTILHSPTWHFGTMPACVTLSMCGKSSDSYRTHLLEMLTLLTKMFHSCFPVHPPSFGELIMV